jgi:hypothetical protein
MPHFAARHVAARSAMNHRRGPPPTPHLPTEGPNLARPNDFFKLLNDENSVVEKTRTTWGEMIFNGKYAFKTPLGRVVVTKNNQVWLNGEIIQPRDLGNFYRELEQSLQPLMPPPPAQSTEPSSETLPSERDEFSQWWADPKNRELERIDLGPTDQQITANAIAGLLLSRVPAINGTAYPQLTPGSGYPQLTPGNGGNNRKSKRRKPNNKKSKTKSKTKRRSIKTR